MDTSDFPTLLPAGFPLDQIVARLRTVPGVVAIVLGGSWAAGRARPDSDVDIGIYYHPSTPLDIPAIRQIAETFNDTPNPVVTELGQWGPWVNGGSWMTIGGRRADFLYKDLDFIDDSSRVQLKGKVACEIHSADELVLTELILDNVLAPYEPAEIVALLSAFVFQEKTDTVPNLTGNLERGMKTIIEISEKVNERQTYHQVILSSDDSNDFVSRPRFGLMEVVYEWARGMSFKVVASRSGSCSVPGRLASPP